MVAVSALAADVDCVSCHEEKTPNIVVDWKLSSHFKEEVGCADCHGEDHASADDVAEVETITAATCGTCHEERLEEFSRGEARGGLGGVRGNADEPCPADGPRAGQEGMRRLSQDRPQNHPQWEMWSSSKHGVRYLLKQNGTLPETTPAPTCQTCHMVGGDHEVRTAWGFLAVRLPLPEDEQWKADQVTILQALGVLDPEGNPTGRLDVVKAADVARLTQEAFDAERNKMLAVCSDCHSENFARGELAKGDEMIREADHLLARRSAIVAGAVRRRRDPQARELRPSVPRPAHLPRRADARSSNAVRDAPQAPHARLPGHLPRQPGLRAVVRLERDGARWNASNRTLRKKPTSFSLLNESVCVDRLSRRPNFSYSRAHSFPCRFKESEEERQR